MIMFKRPEFPIIVIVICCYLLLILTTKLSTDSVGKQPVEIVEKKIRDYSYLTVEKCETDEECEIAEAISQYRDNLILSNTQYIPVLEPIICADNDISCEEANKNAGKPVVIPAMCLPYVED